MHHFRTQCILCKSIELNRKKKHWPGCCTIVCCCQGCCLGSPMRARLTAAVPCDWIHGPPKASTHMSLRIILVKHPSIHQNMNGGNHFQQVEPQTQSNILKQTPCEEMPCGWANYIDHASLPANPMHLNKQNHWESGATIFWSPLKVCGYVLHLDFVSITLRFDPRRGVQDPPKSKLETSARLGCVAKSKLNNDLKNTVNPRIQSIKIKFISKSYNLVPEKIHWFSNVRWFHMISQWF